MSKTVMKNGATVEESLKRLCKETEFAFQGMPFVSVGQVAKDSGYSKPTCRKYLDMLWLNGCASRAGYNGMFIYSDITL